VGAYQIKLEAIAAHEDVQLTVVVPPYWREGDHRLALERATVEGYDLVVAPLALNGRFHLHFYPTLPAILARSRPDVCHIDEEPYNLATYLALRAARRVGAQALFFTGRTCCVATPFRSGRWNAPCIAARRPPSPAAARRWTCCAPKVMPARGRDPAIRRRSRSLLLRRR
jgi:hypothetical protein